MKDKAFERLLQDSIRTYGHEYPKEADQPAGFQPLPHTFPEHFLDDIALPSEKPKPTMGRVIRILSACAAVLAILTVMTVVPLLVTHHSRVPTADDTAVPPFSAMSENTVPSAVVSREPAMIQDASPAESDRSVVPSETKQDKPTYSNGVSVSDSRDGDNACHELPAGSKSAERVREPSADGFDYAAEASASLLPSAGDSAGEFFELPEELHATLTVGEQQVRLFSGQTVELLEWLADGCRKDNHQTAEPELTGQTVLIRLTIVSEDEPIVWGEWACDDGQAVVTEQACYFTLHHDGQTETYRIDRQDTAYARFCEAAQALS